jgi:hypothetical protein
MAMFIPILKLFGFKKAFISNNARDYRKPFAIINQRPGITGIDNARLY